MICPCRSTRSAWPGCVDARTASSPAASCSTSAHCPTTYDVWSGAGSSPPSTPASTSTTPGVPSRSQRQWAAVLALAPAALHRETALEAAGLTQDRTLGPRHGRSTSWSTPARTPLAPDGVQVERVRDAASWVVAVRRPPRATVEFASLKVASEQGRVRRHRRPGRRVPAGPHDTGAPARLSWSSCPGSPVGPPWSTVLADVDAGVHSVLEHRFLDRVERAHGLPAGARQVRVVSGDRGRAARRALPRAADAGGAGRSVRPQRHRRPVARPRPRPRGGRLGSRSRCASAGVRCSSPAGSPSRSVRSSARAAGSLRPRPCSPICLGRPWAIRGTRLAPIPHGRPRGRLTP